MNIKKNILDFLYDRNYFIAMYEDILFIHGYTKIEMLSKTKVILFVENKKYIINGQNMETSRLLTNEISLKGIFENIKVLNE